MSLSQQVWVEKTPVKKNVPGAEASKEGHAVSFDMRGPITIDILEKYVTVNIVSYCQLFRHYFT